jgi:triacylglycerol lipase
LEVQLDDLVGQGAGRRFNLIGHSMGGLDARFLAVGLGRVDLVASIVTIGTPHHGTPVADLTHGLVDDAAAVKFWMDFGAAALAELFGQKGEESSLVAALGSMTTEALSEFNAQVPDHEDVYYASWAGVTCGALDVGCQAACEGEIVHPLLAASHFALWLSGTPNDGLVPVESAAWGDYRGELCGDHADEVGLFAGPGSAGFDHLAFYLDEVRRLADLGF